MQLNMTARHLKLTPAIADYVQKKLQKAKRYFDHLIWAQVILDVVKNRHSAEIVIHATGRTFTAKEESIDLYAAIDLASDNIDEQLRRHKDRCRMRRGTPRGRRGEEAWAMPSGFAVPFTSDHRVSSMRVLRLSPGSLPEAIASM